jgi:hypothetical protein
MSQYDKEFAIVIGGAAVLIAAVLALFVSLILLVDSWQCAKYEEATGKPTKYSGAMCYVQDGGKWYAWAEYKHRLATKGAF